MKLNQEEVFNDEETLTTNPNELFQNVNDNSDRKDLEQYKAMLHNLKDLILEEQEKLSLEYKFDKQWLIFDQAKITLFKLKEIENKMQNYEKERKEIENKLINLKKDYNTLEIEKTEFEDRFYNLNIKNKMLGQKL
ncbi:MAG: hypothetical protein REH79_01370, partial [Spiroplasma sp.]|nr:hypothetical protein [Spiroplasma sp.]